MRPLTVWIIGDGKPGHENQSLGLADALGRHCKCDVHRISLAGAGGMIGRMRAALAAVREFPVPHLVIGAGHATHLVLLVLARKYHAKSVVLMRPSMPLSWFDWCIAPAHDFPKGAPRENVILTRGAINRVVPSHREKTAKLILIGGPSKTHAWDSATILEMLAQVTDRGGWKLTDSRRTPDDFIEQVRERLPGVTAFSHHETVPSWLPTKLQQSKEVWVTEDSVSMVYEALTSGARVGLLPMPRIKDHSRVLHGLDQLLEDGYLTSFEKWQHTQRLENAPSTLAEADRCAKVLAVEL